MKEDPPIRTAHPSTGWGAVEYRDRIPRRVRKKYAQPWYIQAPVGILVGLALALLIGAVLLNTSPVEVVRSLFGPNTNELGWVFGTR